MPSKKKSKKPALPAPDTDTTTDTSTSDPQSWTSLTPPLPSWLLTALSTLSFDKMTPVQASTIPLFQGNKDVVVQAVTGSGKTLAFLIPLVTRLCSEGEGQDGRRRPRHHVGGIIVSPTRELAAQIHTVLQSLLNFQPTTAPLRTQLLLGGEGDTRADLKTFLRDSPDVLVATPGRLDELLSSRYVFAAHGTFEVLVLDEADRLLDLGFAEVVSRILTRLPKQRRTGLFSASLSEARVRTLIRAGLRNPVRVVVRVVEGEREKRTPVSLENSYLVAAPEDRYACIARILGRETPLRCIVYFSNCASVDHFAALFGVFAGGFALLPLHGKQSPTVRKRNFTAFATTTTPAILLTTDLAARGLDVPDVDLVLQLDPPTDPKAFLHRAGRAARAGRRGRSVVFLSPGREEEYIDFLSVRKTPVTPYPSTPTTTTAPVEAQNTTETILHEMRKRILKDRALHDKALRAFVSHVRAYSKHAAASIFRLADMDWSSLARAFGLLWVPLMPELRGVRVDLGLEGEVDRDTYGYRDKVRERGRVEGLTTPEAGGKADRDGKRKRNGAWSGKSEAKQVREVRREKRKRRKVAGLSEEGKGRELEWKELVEEVKKQRAENKDKDKEHIGGFADLE